MKKYYAFGLTIKSDFLLPQVPETESKNVDVYIKRTLLKEDDASLWQDSYQKTLIKFGVENVGRFRITNGNLIEASPINDDESHFAIFLMGSAMGAILHQRGEMPLHGSCVTNGEETILITGDSGAGKSTLARVFLKHGWKLLTDDVAVIKDPEGEILVKPSYPSQKIWENSPEFGEESDNEIHSLYVRDGKNKFGIKVKDKFVFDSRALTMVVRLIATDNPAELRPIEGFAKVDQLMQNTYRPFMIMREDLDRHFQRCVTMARKLPMYMANRNLSDTNPETVYELITGQNAVLIKNHGTPDKTILDKSTTGNNKGNNILNITAMNGDTIIKRKENIITADMNGSAVTMDIKTGRYYDLGETGGEIWNLIKEARTFDSLIDAITEEYEIAREDCEADIKRFLNKLIDDGLVYTEN